MDFKQFFEALSPPEQKRFAEISGGKVDYLRTHLAAPARRRRVPRKDLMEGLHRALREFGVDCEKESLLAYFYENCEERT